MATFSLNSDTNGKSAFLFPGQGSQFVGMGYDIYKSSSAARKIFHEVNDTLETDLTSLMFHGPEEELAKTFNAQPAILTASLATWRAMQDTLESSFMPEPSLLAGHSLGEYTALVVSGALEFSDAVRLVRERGRLMQQASEMSRGGMAVVIGLNETTVNKICKKTGTQVSNINAVDQVVISGKKRLLNKAMKMAELEGAGRIIPLRVSGAFHSTLMEPAVAELSEAIEHTKFRQAKIPIVANLTGRPIRTGRAIINELVHQVVGCVHWVRSVHYMLTQGIGLFLELGPGRVLGGLVRRMSRNVQVASIGDMESILALAAR